MIWLLFFSLLLVCAGCSKAPVADDTTVRTLVKERINKPVRWYQGSAEESEIQCLIQHLLQKELELDAAMQIALFNNPSIQATFEELGIKQADLVQAGLFQNPVLQGFIRFPDHGGVTTNTEFSVMQSFLELFLIPLRKKFAQTALRQAELKVAEQVLHIAFDVREVYCSLQSELAILQYLKVQSDATYASFLLARGQYLAGNTSMRLLQEEEGSYLQAKLNVVTSENKIVGLKKELIALLGVRVQQESISLSKTVPLPQNDQFSLDALKEIAFCARLDLEHARLECNRIAELGATKKWWAYTDAAVGASGERDPEGRFVLGPIASVDLPLFNHGQADRARLLSELKQSKLRLHALELEVVYELQAALKELENNQKVVSSFANEIVPLKREFVATLQQEYNVMGISAYTLLKAKQEELEAHIGYQLALRDYWLARVHLDRNLGTEHR